MAATPDSSFALVNRSARPTDYLSQDYVYNFAYGANIYPPDKLHIRPGTGTTPDTGKALRIQFESYELAKLHGYRLAFNFEGMPPLEPSMGTVEKITQSDLDYQGKDPFKDLGHFNLHVNGFMYGALIRLRRDEYEKLWISEGGAWPDPKPYNEVVVECEVMSGERVRAIVYQGAWKPIHNRDIIPSKRYIELVTFGARKLGVPESYLDLLLSVPRLRPLPWALQICAYQAFALGFHLRNMRTRNILSLQATDQDHRFDSIFRTCRAVVFQNGMLAANFMYEVQKFCEQKEKENKPFQSKLIFLASDAIMLSMLIPVGLVAKGILVCQSYLKSMYIIS